MAFTKKKKRHITVEGYPLFWVASGSDNGINLTILSDFGKRGKVFATFDYHSIGVPMRGNGFSYTLFTDHFIVTPYIVRQVVQLAFAQGWDPMESKVDLHLGQVDSYVDLRLDQNRVSYFKNRSEAIKPGSMEC